MSPCDTASVALLTHVTGPAGHVAAMFLRWIESSPRPVIVEDPYELGYRLVAHPLLDVMDAERWYELEHAAALGPGAAFSEGC